MPLEAAKATAAQCREQAESWQRYAAKAAEKEHEQRVAEAEAKLRLDRERVQENRARVEALTRAPDPTTAFDGLETKVYAAENAVELKASDFGARTLTVLASCFNVRDRVGDLVPEHAYDEFLRSDAAQALPVYFQHVTKGTPPLGEVMAWQKTPAGLVATVRVFAGEANDKLLAATHGLLEAARRTGRRAVSMSASIGYVARKVSWRQVGGLHTRILDAIDLRELSLCNPDEAACPGAGVVEAKTAATLAPPKTPAENAARLAQHARALEDEIYHLEQRQRETNDQHYNSLVEEAGAAERVRQRAKARAHVQRVLAGIRDGAVADARAQEERRAMLQRLAQFGLSLPGDRP